MDLRILFLGSMTWVARLRLGCGGGKIVVIVFWVKIHVWIGWSLSCGCAWSGLLGLEARDVGCDCHDGRGCWIGWSANEGEEKRLVQVLPVRQNRLSLEELEGS